MIKFISTTEEHQKPYTAVESIEMKVGEEVSLPDLLEAFEGFLKACGYHIPEGSYIDVVSMDEDAQPLPEPGLTIVPRLDK